MRIMEIFHLDDMTPGQRAEVLALRTESRMRRRLLDLGLVPGTRVECVGQSPGGDPKAYLIRGAAVAIRSEAEHGDAVGVSMAARASEVTDPAVIARLNQQVLERYPELHVYAPAGASVAVIHLRPEIVSPVGVIDGRSVAHTYSVG